MANFGTDDDIYVNAGDSYDTTFYPSTEDPDVREAELNQKAIQAASYPIIGDIADWFDEQIKALDSRTNVGDYAEMNSLPKEAVGEAFDIARKILEAKFDEFKDFRHER